MIQYAEFSSMPEYVLIEDTLGMLPVFKIKRIKTNGRAIDMTACSYYWSKDKNRVVSVGMGELARAKILSLDKYQKINLRERSKKDPSFTRSIKVDHAAMSFSAKDQL